MVMALAGGATQTSSPFALIALAATNPRSAVLRASHAAMSRAVAGLESLNSSFMLTLMDADVDLEAGLVMGMPRRELFAVRGFQVRIEMAVLDSLENEFWFATPQVLADDLEAKEVQVGVVFLSDSQVLVNEHGVLLHTTSVPPEAMDMGPCLRSLRDLARIGAERLIDAQARGVLLRGYLNDDQLEECRPYLIMVYEVRFSPDVPAPEGMTWVDRRHLRDVALDPVSIQVADSLTIETRPGG